MAKFAGEPPDKEVLVVAAILGDLGAFDELAARYRAAVVRTAQSIVGREDAEDVAQDTLLLAFKALPSIDEPRGSRRGFRPSRDIGRFDSANASVLIKLGASIWTSS